MIVFLDSAPLSDATNPTRGDANAAQCARWVQNLVVAGVTVCIPEIIDYELRRVLIWKDRREGIRRLNDLRKIAEFVPLSQSAISKAAELWAYARKNGIRTAHDEALDIDMLLLAQVQSHFIPDGDVVIATADVSDLSRFAVDARKWQDISIP